VVSTTGNVAMNIFNNSERLKLVKQTIVVDTRCVPAVETAGYVFPLRMFSQYNPWF
jgi:hypothetical protein